MCFLIFNLLNSFLLNLLFNFELEMGSMSLLYIVELAISANDIAALLFYASNISEYLAEMI